MNKFTILLILTLAAILEAVVTRWFAPASKALS